MNLGNRYSQHSFSQVPSVNIQRSRFDRSSAAKTTMYFDYLTPIFVDEVLPGDDINLNVKTFARLAPQVVPLLDNMYIDFFFFFVPNRLVWDNWEKFMGAQDNPGDSTDYLCPVIKAPDTTGFANESIFDYFDVPPAAEKIEVNAFVFRAYNLIWNEWFRDQNLQNSVTVPLDDGPDPEATYTLLKRGKRHDYFTSALPWPQKGPSIMMPLGTSAPVYGPELSSADTGNIFQWWNRNSSDVVSGSIQKHPSATAEDRVFYTVEGPTSGTPAGGLSLGTQSQYEGTNGQPPYADLSEATAATINQFRQAMMMQSILELDARAGTRYVEILKAHYNVISPDFRLQRPEFLSGGEIRINQHVVAQTSETTSDDKPLGLLAAYSTAAEFGSKIGFSKSFTEHGHIIGLACARADITYQYGLHRMYSRQTRWDFFWPKFQELGEQAILNKEIYATGSSTDDEVFGYAERFAEYRYKPSTIRGQFRSTYTATLDVWHMAEDYESLPALNDTFIQQSTPIERSLVVVDGYPHLLVDFWFDQKHARPMMTYGIPATLGRF
ncbi:MAG: major capsid protein [Candidatus Hadarchaeum sp.]